jgi:hypothetical protein
VLVQAEGLQVGQVIIFTGICKTASLQWNQSGSNCGSNLTLQYEGWFLKGQKPT